MRAPARQKVVEALKNSIRVTSKTLLPTLAVVTMPVLFLYPLDYVIGRVDLFATKLAPETIAGLLFAKIVVEIAVGFALVGAVTRLFIWRLEAR